MFSNNDKFNLTVTNMINSNGNILPITIELPVENPISLPRDIVKVGIFEFQEGNFNGGQIAFNIFIGKVAKLRTVIDNCKNSNKKITLGTNVDLTLIDEYVCYIDKNNNECFVISEVTENDMVVSDISQMSMKIMEISYLYKDIKQNISRVKLLKSQSRKV